MPFVRRSLPGGGAVLVETELETDGFLAAFSERTGGVSPAPFDSLNLSLVTADDPANGRVNRRRLVDGLGVPPFATAYQVHGARVAEVDASGAGAGFGDPGTRIPDADALVTSAQGLPLAVLTADCLPVVLASARDGRVATVHCGWRGLAAGMLACAVEAFADPAALRAAIGPAIGPCHYEVGEEVLAAVASGAGVAAVTSRRDGASFLDLGSTAAAALRALGVGRVETADLCTACEPDRFFSHRRDGERTGRQIAIAMRR